VGVSTAIEAVKAGWASMAGRVADGKMPVHLVVPDGDGPFGGVIVAMEAFGLDGHMKSVAERIAREGDVVAAPDFYYRAVGERVVGYDQLPRAIELVMERASGIKLMIVMTPELSDVASTAPLRQAPESTQRTKPLSTKIFPGRRSRDTCQGRDSPKNPRRRCSSSLGRPSLRRSAATRAPSSGPSRRPPRARRPPISSPPSRGRHV